MEKQFAVKLPAAPRTVAIGNRKVLGNTVLQNQKDGGLGFNVFKGSQGVDVRAHTGLTGQRGLIKRKEQDVKDPWIQIRESSLESVEMKGDKILPTSDVIPIDLFKNIGSNEEIVTINGIPEKIVKSKAKLFLQDDPIKDITVYFDRGSHSSNITEKVKEVNEHISNIRSVKNDANRLRPLTSASGKVTRNKFEDALEVYENNQATYLDMLERGWSKKEISSELTNLESWFICIIEPKPKSKADIHDWENREKKKLSGKSAYCDPDCEELITPLPPQIMSIVHGHLQQ